MAELWNPRSQTGSTTTSPSDWANVHFTFRRWTGLDKRCACSAFHNSFRVYSLQGICFYLWSYFFCPSATLTNFGGWKIKHAIIQFTLSPSMILSVPSLKGCCFGMRFAPRAQRDEAALVWNQIWVGVMDSTWQGVLDALAWANGLAGSEEPDCPLCSTMAQRV